MPVIAPTSSLEAHDSIFHRAKTASLLFAAAERPRSIMSEATEIYDTDFEGGSDDEWVSPKPGLDSSERRRSQTTISSYDEVPTPRSRTSPHGRPFDFQPQPVEGPKGPHLFRASTVSAEFDFDHALQMSPLLPKDPPFRTNSTFTEETMTPITSLQTGFSLEAAIQRPLPDFADPQAHIRSWSTQEVIDWMCETGIDASIIECFDIHDINGTVLLDLQFEDLKELDIQSFGKRHQLWNAICLLRGEDAHPSPQATPFQDISRPCTTNTRRSPSRTQQPSSDDDESPTNPPVERKRRARKASKSNDIITPMESVSIVAIEQLLPKPHKCSKGEKCAKWRKQQREIQQLHDEHGLGRFPVSPTKGGRIFIAGDPGNAHSAENLVLNVQRQQEAHLSDHLRPMSEAPPSVIVPSLVASSDLLGPGQLPDFTLHEDMLNQLGSRDPQDNVKQFLNFQHINSHTPEEACHGSTERFEMFPSQSISPFPAQYPQAPISHEQLRSLPRLEIPRSASAGPQAHNVLSPDAVGESICRSSTASPSRNAVYRLGTPASEMDIPVTATTPAPIARDASQSVPPNMQFRPQQHLSRSYSRAGGAPDWRRPSMALPAVKEGEVFSCNSDANSRPSISTTRSYDSASMPSVRDPAHHSPTTRQFGYGENCTQAGWMKKRRTKVLRHEWQDAHFRLKGTQLTQHANARLSAVATDTINVDDYSVACSSIQSTNKLAAAMKAFNIKTESSSKKDSDPTAFAFQLVPAPKEGARRVAVHGKTHHFAVKNKDERIDWMRQIMVSKALQAKAQGYEVEVNGVRHE